MRTTSAFVRIELYANDEVVRDGRGSVGLPIAACTGHAGLRRSFNWGASNAER
jgi:hypothetical protein